MAPRSWATQRIGWPPGGRTVPAALVVVALMILGAGAALFSPLAGGARGAPTAGNGLSVTGASPASISLSWPPTSGLLSLFVSYQVELSANGSFGPWTVVATYSNPSESTFYDAGLTAGATYSWQVVTNEVAGSSTSNVVTFAQPAVATLSGSLSGDASVRLGWTNSAPYGGDVNFGSYAVAESTSGGPFVTVNTSLTVTDLSLTISGLTPATPYAFTVTTTDLCAGAANCNASTPASSTTSSALPLTTPPLLAASIVPSSPKIDNGSAAGFTCAPKGGLGPFLYAWNFGDGTSSPGTSTVGSAVHTFSKEGNFTVACFVTDSLGSSVRATVLETVAASSGGGGGTGGGGCGTTCGGGGGTGGGGTNGGGGPGGGGGSGGNPGTPGSSSRAHPSNVVPLAAFGLFAVFLIAVILLVATAPRRRKHGPAPSAQRERPAAGGRSSDWGRPGAASDGPVTSASRPSSGPSGTAPERNLDDVFDRLDSGGASGAGAFGPGAGSADLPTAFLASSPPARGRILPSFPEWAEDPVLPDAGRPADPRPAGGASIRGTGH